MIDPRVGRARIVRRPDLLASQSRQSNPELAIVFGTLLGAFGLATATGAVAETIVVNDQVQVRESQMDRPKRGSTMADVEKRFGAPVTRHPTVGGAPQQPPITRWDYNGFSVVFERARVIQSVVTGSSVTSTSVAGT